MYPSKPLTLEENNQESILLNNSLASALTALLFAFEPQYASDNLNKDLGIGF
jgi:hypothetical protein